MSDQIAVMNEGRVEQVGTPEDVYLRPQTPFVAGFLGAVNWIGPVGVRPEATRIAAESADGARGSVTGSVFLGDSVEVLVRLESGEEIVARTPRHAAKFRPGDAVRVRWDPADELRFS